MSDEFTTNENGSKTPEETNFQDYTAPENDVDLLIRPGSDKRVSNFLLWQLAYAEFWYTDLCWPDFTKETLIEAILSFQGRERRFGGLK